MYQACRRVRGELFTCLVSVGGCVQDAIASDHGDRGSSLTPEESAIGDVLHCLSSFGLVRVCGSHLQEAQHNSIVSCACT